jgi:hypothetical protein
VADVQGTVGVGQCGGDGMAGGGLHGVWHFGARRYRSAPGDTGSVLGEGQAPPLSWP